MTGSHERRVLLDTSVIIDPPARGTASFADEVSVSAVTAGELHYGVGASTDPVEQWHRRQRLQLVLDTYDVRNWSGPRSRVTRCQTVSGRQGRPSARVVRAAKKWMTCLAAVAR